MQHARLTAANMLMYNYRYICIHHSFPDYISNYVTVPYVIRHIQLMPFAGCYEQFVLYLSPQSVLFIQYEKRWCLQLWLRQMQDKKSFLTHKLDAQVICCFTQQDGRRREREREKRKQLLLRIAYNSIVCYVCKSSVVTRGQKTHVSKITQ